MKTLMRGAALTLVALTVGACGGGGGGGDEGGGGQGNNNTPQPGVIGFAAAANAADENGGTVNIVVNRTSGSDGQVQATLAVAGTASSGTDFTAPPTTVTIAAGATSATVAIALANDAVAEEDETVTLTLSAPTGGATLASTTTHTLTIRNDDAPAAPEVTVASSMKQLTFSWAATPTSTRYRLLANPDGASGFSPALPDITTGTTAILPVSVHLQNWTQARYRVSACNAAGCTDSDEVSLTTELMLGAIGNIVAAGVEAFDGFGEAVAMSGDGKTLAVGARREESNATGINGDRTNNNAPGSGAVYIFERQDNGQWQEKAYLKASNARFEPGAGPLSGPYFGGALSLSDDGSALVVGADGETSAATGVNGNQASTGAPLSGAAYVFNRSASGQWSQTAYLKASNTEAADEFGAAVSISGDGRTIAVGAIQEDSGAVLINGAENDNSTPDTGAVYVFELSASGWAQTAYVKPHLRIGVDALIKLGGGVALDRTGSALAVGSNARGIYWYLKDANGWQFDSVLNVSFVGLGSLTMSRDGKTTVMGVPTERNGAGQDVPGVVYVFTKESDGWKRTASLHADPTLIADLFGASVAVGSTGQCIAVGAFLEGSNATGVGGNPFDTSAPKSGAAYYFERNTAGEWVQRTYIKSPSATSVIFGTALAMSADCSVVASWAKPELISTSSGSFYLY